MLEKEVPRAVDAPKTTNFSLEKSTLVRGKAFEPFGKDGVSFLDFLDIINPLQHIPLVATLYRKITGDEIDPGSRLAGSALYGGALGAVTSLIDVMIEFNTGRDIGEHALEVAGRDNIKPENTPLMEEKKKEENPMSMGNSRPGFLTNKTASEDLHPDIPQNGLNNPFLAEQRADYQTTAAALLKKIDAGIKIDEKMRFTGKVQNHYATGAYNEAFYLK